MDEKILIEGLTEDNKVFRPADWAERMCGSLSTFRQRRMIYSPLLQPVTLNDIHCVILDTSLKVSNPGLFAEILEFAHENKLKIRPYTAEH